MFEKMNRKDISCYMHCINEERPVSECPVQMTDEEKKYYRKSLVKLQEERRLHPGMPIAYQDTFYDDEWPDEV